MRIHGLDEETKFLIEQKSKEWGLSLNDTVQVLIKQSLGIQPQLDSNKSCFARFLGSWSVEELAEFESNTRALGRVEQGDWK